MNDRPDRPPPGGHSGDRTIETELGPQLVLRFYGLTRAVRLYDVTHQAVQAQLDQFEELLGRFGGEDVALLAMGQHFYLNGNRVRAQSLQLLPFSALTAELELRGLGGLHFLAGVNCEELARALPLLLGVTDRIGGEGLPGMLTDAGVHRFMVIPAGEIGASHGVESAGAGEMDEGARARQVYWRAVAGSRSVLESTARTGRPALRQARRVVQPLVDALMKNENSIVGLAALKDHDEYTYAHCVNVSTLSIAIGLRLGLDRTMLASLGVAALMHDLGKLAVPPGILQKAGKLDPEEWAQIQRHPQEGVRLITRLPGLSADLLDCLWVCFQHHLTVNGQGYPRIEREWTMALSARIVAAADCFDAMTGHRAYRSRPMTGYEALQQLLGHDEARFDAAVLWALVWSVGLYPAGTVMETRSGHIVLSMSPNGADPRRPVCQILRRPDGSVPGEGDMRAWEPMPDAESVARVVPPEEIEFELPARRAA